MNTQRRREGRKKITRSLSTNPRLAGLRQFQEGAGAWGWTKQKRLALRLFLDGHSMQAIGERIDVNRSTVSRWTRTPEFRKEAATRLRERIILTTIRRMRLLGGVLDEIERRVLQDFIAGKSRDDETDTLFGWMEEYRLLRKVERIDLLGEPMSLPT